LSFAVGKYLHVFGLGIQNTLVYRVNFLFRAAFGLIPLAGTLFLWKSIYAGKEPGAVLGGYTLAQMISYYLLVTLVDAVTAVAEDDWQIAADIKDGQVSQFLLKPMDYLTYRLCLYGSGRAVYTTMALIPVSVFIVFQRENFVLPSDAATLSLALASIVMAGILQFFIAYMVALQAIPVSIAFPSVASSYAIIAVLGAVLWAEPIGWPQAAGIALICLGVVLLYRG
jgi:ABC-2 type transport system permease protein